MTRASVTLCVALLWACSSHESTAERAPPAPAPTAPAAASTPPPPQALEELARPEPLALHMRDHVGLATQARDAIVRGQLGDATGALTWLAQHRELAPEAAAGSFLERVRQHAQGALDAKDLRGAAESLGALAASCGDCHRATGKGPEAEPTGLEELDERLTVETHMHSYLWATDILWQGLIGDSALWQTGVQTLATLEAPEKPRKLAGGFAAIATWAKDAGKLQSSSERGRAYGELIAICGSCHIANGIEPGRAR